MREFLKGLDLDKETIDTIMAEHGKTITSAKEELQTLKDDKKALEDKVDELGKNSKDSSKIQEELDALKTSIEETKKANALEEEDNILSKNINTAFGESKFVNDYTKKQIQEEIKTALKNKENAGKSAKELFEELTKDKEGIFQNPNQVFNMEGNGKVDKTATDDARNRELMGLEPAK